ncbi:MAG TPA: zf-HC2 domain-containing protein, partial [Planctomycetota bacterium]|nr:zf-HC2 domain-containing protein [Planctomycetota bacterium]
MDKHNQLEENLVAYLANELSTAERAELEQHLLGCAPCRESLVRARAVLDQADALPQIEPPPGYTQRVLHAARAAQQQAR